MFTYVDHLVRSAKFVTRSKGHKPRMKTVTIRTVKVLLTFDGARERFRDVLESIRRASEI